MTGLRARLLVAATIAGAFVTGAVLAAGRTGLTTEITAVAEPAPALVTAEVDRRVLEDTVVTRGSIAVTDLEPVGWPSLGDVRPVVTSVDVALGSRVGEGDAVASISGRPVIVLEGAFPAFRDWERGVEGVDITQLQESLTRLGLYGGAIDGSFGWAVERAAIELYRRNGYEPTSAAAGTEGSELHSTAGVRIPLDGVVFLPELPATVVALHTDVGAVPAEGIPIMELSAGEARVMTTVPASHIDAIELGMRAAILDERSGTTFEAEVIEIAATPLRDSEVLGHEVGLRPLESVTDLIGNNVRVTFTLRVTDGAVIVVPLTAAWTSNGDTFITISDGGTNRDVGVELGLFVDGWVEVINADAPLSKGDRVAVTR